VDKGDGKPNRLKPVPPAARFQLRSRLVNNNRTTPLCFLKLLLIKELSSKSRVNTDSKGFVSRVESTVFGGSKTVDSKEDIESAVRVNEGFV
jgi:hypothetical protein